jgi:hypothetical protein
LDGTSNIDQPRSNYFDNFILNQGKQMNCNNNSGITPAQLNTAMTLVNFAMTKIFPAGSYVTSQMTIVTQTGATVTAIQNGNTGAPTVIPGVSISGPTLAMAAKIEGFIAAVGLVTGATVGLTGGLILLGLSAIVTAAAITSNRTALHVRNPNQMNAARYNFESDINEINI